MCSVTHCSIVPTSATQVQVTVGVCSLRTGERRGGKRRRREEEEGAIGGGININLTLKMVYSKHPQVSCVL